MSPTRRDTLKAAGAASALTVLGGHAVAQQDTTEDDDQAGGQALQEGEAGVRAGHFVVGAPAVNVRLVPADDGADSAADDEDDTTAGAGGDNDTDNTTAGGNDTDEDLQQDTADGEGQTIAENLSFGDVSEYANVDAGTYTLQLVEADGETADTDDEPIGAGDDNETDVGDDNDTDVGTDNDTDVGADNDTNGGVDADNDTNGGIGDDNDTDVGADNESDDEDDGGIFSVSEHFQQNDNDTDDDIGADNDTNGGIGDDNDTDIGDDNDTDIGDDNDTDVGADNDTDDGVTDDTTTDENVLYEQEVTVGETFYTAAAVGQMEEDNVQVSLLNDYDAAQVRLVHASPDAPAVDVVAPDANMTLFDGVSFGQATEYVGVPPGSYSLEIREEAQMNDGDEVATVDADFEAGRAYTAFAIGSVEGGDEEFQVVIEEDGKDAQEAADTGVDTDVGDDNDTDVGADNDTDVGDDNDTDIGDDNESDDEDSGGILAF